ncbi:MAG: TonB-dependent receptor [Bacteroidaceae bacterium]|nr:TonB-dependent receptor [Bacteroidaceae bacterium]
MKRVFKVNLLTLLLCCISGIAMAQDKVMVRGTVTAAEDGFGLPGAYVQVQAKDGRTVAATVTDMDGNYSLMSDGKAGDVLIVSYSGYKKQTIEIANKTQIDVVLREDVQELQTATIVAKRMVNNGMMNIAERDLTSASKRIDMSELQEMGSADVGDALQGRIAGVDMVASSGAPGAGMAIRIRGTTTINGSSQPLIVVDGFPYDATISDDFDFGTANEEDYSQMLNIAPSDIKEITVLKDAAATAIYGSKAANGVLQITTKRGGVSKPRIQYTFKGQVSELRKGIPTLSGDEYVTLIQEMLMNSGNTFNPYNYPELSNDANNPYNYYNYGQNTDWFDAVTRTGFAQDHNISISGGDAKAQYRASVGYYDQSGIVIGQDFTRMNARMNVDYNISEKFRVSASLAYTYSERDANYVTYLDSKYDVLSQAYVRAPNMSIYEYNEAGIRTDNYFTPEETLQGRWTDKANSQYNPVAMANDGFYKQETHRIVPTLTAIWRPIEQIRYEFSVGFDINNNKKNAFVPQTATGRPWTENTVNKAADGDAEAFNMNIYNKLFYTPNLGDNHSLTLMLGTNTNNKIEKGYGAVIANTASHLLTDPSNGGRLTNGGSLTSSSSEYRAFSVYGMAQYSYLDRYIGNITVRRDGTSKFGADYRWGTYPSLSGRWRISGEPFLQQAAEKWLDELSLRFSWGVNGNEVGKGYYPSVASYAIYNGMYLDKQGTYQSALEAVQMRWEDTQQYNAGLNFAAFQGRLTLEFDYYMKHTKDLFLNDMEIPSHTGFTKMGFNAATMDNTGWEVQGTVTPIRNKDWTLNVNFNFARNENRLKEISELYPQETGSWQNGGEYIRMIKAGQPLGSFYGFMYDGVYLNQDETIARDAKGNKIYTYDAAGNRMPVQTTFNYPSVAYEFQPGDARYVDVNHDGNIDAQDVVYLGNSMPLLTGGFGFNLKYKAWSLSTFFNFRYGNDVVNMAKLNMEKMSGFDNQSKAVLRRWRHPYDDASQAPKDLLPRAVYGQHYNYLASDRFVEDGSFVRFKQLTVKYTVPREKLQNFFISDASVYVTAQNLFCWTKYTGMDPEVSVGNPFNSGYDHAASPRSKEYWMGINLSF